MTWERAERAGWLQVHALAYDLASFLRTLTPPGQVGRWSLARHLVDSAREVVPGDVQELPAATDRGKRAR